MNVIVEVKLPKTDKLLNCLLGVPAWWHALRARHACVLCVLACSPTYVLACLTCLRVRVLSMFACFMSLHAQMSYILAVLKYFTCLRACVLGILVCLICFTLEKLISYHSIGE